MVIVPIRAFPLQLGSVSCDLRGQPATVCNSSHCLWLRLSANHVARCIASRFSSVVYLSIIRRTHRACLIFRFTINGGDLWHFGLLIHQFHTINFWLNHFQGKFLTFLFTTRCLTSEYGTLRLLIGWWSIVNWRISYSVENRVTLKLNVTGESN